MTKTDTLYLSKKHRTFGGYIYIEDFYTDYPPGNIANRITQDWKFDKMCQKNCEIRDSKRKEHD